MSSTLLLSPVDVFTARARNVRTWTRCSAALMAGRLAEAVADFAPDVRLHVADPVAGMPSVVAGTEGIVSTWQSFADLVRSVTTLERRFEQTEDPDVACVEQQLRVELRDGTVRTLRLRTRVTFDDGQIVALHDEEGSQLGVLVDVVLRAARRF